MTSLARGGEGRGRGREGEGKGEGKGREGGGYTTHFPKLLVK